MKLERCFDVGSGLAIRGDVWGESDGPCVIFLPGGGQSRSAWRRTAAMMADEGYRAVALDLRGQGGSDWAPDGDYRFAAYARDLVDVIDALGGCAILAGSSLGGLAALSAAALAPGKVSALVLADVTPRQSGTGSLQIRAMMRSAAEGFADVDEAGLVIARMMGTPPRASNAGLLEHLRQRGDRLYWAWDPRVIDERFVQTPEVLAGLEAAARTLAMPVLLVHAECSNVVTDADVARFATLVPHVALRTLPGAQHMITGDSNHAYGEMIVDFLSSIARAPVSGG